MDDIQKSYRVYHSNGCFLADKYPLMVIDQFFKFLQQLSQRFFMVPMESHPIVQEYNRIFDDVVRFNPQKFPGTIPREDTHLLLGGNTGDEEVFLSPKINDNDDNNDNDNNNNNGGSGFILLESLDQVTEKFLQDSATGLFSPSPNNATTSPSPNDATPSPSPNNATTTTPPPVDAISVNAMLKKEAHPLYPYLIKEVRMFPKSRQEIEELDPLEIEEYELCLLKGFLLLDDTTLSALPIEVVQDYHRIKELVVAVNQRIIAERNPTSPPRDPRGVPWVEEVRITTSEVEQLFCSLRTSSIAAVEREVVRRLQSSERICRENKVVFTDQLEDRIRNHWPRRGRVETQIKQPREAELLSHRQKTWRIIQGLQQRVGEVRQRVDDILQRCTTSGEKYTADMQGLMDKLKGNFKTLAALQVPIYTTYLHYLFIDVMYTALPLYRCNVYCTTSLSM